jgi:hypothetical protein
MLHPIDHYPFCSSHASGGGYPTTRSRGLSWKPDCRPRLRSELKSQQPCSTRLVGDGWTIYGLRRGNGATGRASGAASGLPGTAGLGYWPFAGCGLRPWSNHSRHSEMVIGYRWIKRSQITTTAESKPICPQINDQTGRSWSNRLL